LSKIANKRGAGANTIVRRYYGLWWLYALASGTVYGVYPLFLRARGLSQLEMNSVLATYFFVMFLSDVPTGAFADALGRRRSFVLGCALRMTAYTVYFFGAHYIIFLAAETIDGVGTTFCNGTLDAWAVDALDATGAAAPKDRMFSRGGQLTSFGAMIAAIIGSRVAAIHIGWPWIIGASGFLVTGIVGSRLMEREVVHQAILNPAAIVRELASRIARGMRHGMTNAPVLMMSIANGLAMAAWAPYWLEWPQFFNDRYRIGIWIVGWIFSLFTLANMIGAEAVVRFGAGASRRGEWLAVAALGSGAMFMAASFATGRPSLALASLFGMNVLAGAMQPMARAWLNEHLLADNRATLLSFNSTFATLGAATGLLAGGTIADAHGFTIAWRVGGVLLMLSAPCFWVIRRTPACPATASETPAPPAAVDPAR